MVTHAASYSVLVMLSCLSIVSSMTYYTFHRGAWKTLLPQTLTRHFCFKIKRYLDILWIIIGIIYYFHSIAIIIPDRLAYQIDQTIIRHAP